MQLDALLKSDVVRIIETEPEFEGEIFDSTYETIVNRFDLTTKEGVEGLVRSVARCVKKTLITRINEYKI